MNKVIYFLLINLLIIGCSQDCVSFKTDNDQIYGIDVSHYQSTKKKIDWKKVASNTNPKIEFAYIRSTMGNNGVDTAFTYNFKNAKANGIAVGVYHYFRPNETALDQINNFIKNNTNIGTLPPVIDIEERSIHGARKLRKEITFFLKNIEKKYNIKPIIYAPQKFYNKYFRCFFKNYDFWIARQNGIKKKPKNNSLQKEPFLIDKMCPLIWQYSGTGTIDGITGPVDLNVSKERFWINNRTN